MKIAIDTSCLLINPNCGLSEVVRNLILELPIVEDGNFFTFYYNYFRSRNKIPKNTFPGTENFILRVPRRLVNWSWQLDWLQIDSFLPKTEIYHSLHAQIPPSNRLKKILTVHDCRFLAFPELYSPQTVEWYRRLMNNSFERADIVTTVSRFTRQEIQAHFTIPEDRIKVIYNGFSPYVPAASDCWKKVRRFMQKHNLPKDYLLFVGVLDPRKNLGRLLEALSNLKQENKDFPDMVIAGISPRRWAKSDQAKKMTNIGLSKHIHVIGVVERDILFGITQKALALCYPSLYEGFGFPPLEAMSQGIPVFAGKSSSIPEVTGDAACLVDPLNIDDMVRGLHRIVYDKEYRQKLIERGFDQINRFSWSKAAAEYIQLYKKVLD